MKALITKHKDHYTLKLKTPPLSGQSIKFPLTLSDDAQEVLKHLIYTYHEINSYFQHPSFFQNSPLIIDCGSYPGEFTLLASRMTKNYVISVEPLDINYSYTNKMLKFNKAKGVVLLNKAVGSIPKMVTVNDDRAMSTINLNPIGPGGLSEKAVEQVTIDELVDHFRKDNQDILIKMDIEGHELDALLGMTNTINRFKPNIMVASYHIVDNASTQARVEHFLLNQGYKYVKTLYPDHPVTYASMKAPTKGSLIPLMTRGP